MSNTLDEIIKMALDLTEAHHVLCDKRGNDESKHAYNKAFCGLADRLAALVADAERYKAIRAGYIDILMQVPTNESEFETRKIRADLNYGDESEGIALDAAIDAARATQQTKESQ